MSLHYRCQSHLPPGSKFASHSVLLPPKTAPPHSYPPTTLSHPLSASLPHWASTGSEFGPGEPSWTCARPSQLPSLTARLPHLGVSTRTCTGSMALDWALRRITWLMVLDVTERSSRTNWKTVFRISYKPR